MVDDDKGPVEGEQTELRVIEVHPPLRQRFLRGLLIAWVVLVVVFSVANLHFVDFNWIVGSTEVTPTADGGESGGVPLVLLLAGAFATGMLTGMMIVGFRMRRARKAAEKKRS